MTKPSKGCRLNLQVKFSSRLGWLTWIQQGSFSMLPLKKIQHAWINAQRIGRLTAGTLFWGWGKPFSSPEGYSSSRPYWAVRGPTCLASPFLWYFWRDFKGWTPAFAGLLSPVPSTYMRIWIWSWTLGFWQGGQWSHCLAYSARGLKWRAQDIQISLQQYSCIRDHRCFAHRIPIPSPNRLLSEHLTILLIQYFWSFNCSLTFQDALAVNVQSTTGTEPKGIWVACKVIELRYHFSTSAPCRWFGSPSRLGLNT